MVGDVVVVDLVVVGVDLVVVVVRFVGVVTVLVYEAQRISYTEAMKRGKQQVHRSQDMRIEKSTPATRECFHQLEWCILQYRDTKFEQKNSKPIARSFDEHKIRNLEIQ